MKYLSYLEKNFDVIRSEIEPSKEIEINNIEIKLDIKIPASLREFFLLAGNNYDYIFGGGGANGLKYLSYNNELAKDILKNCNTSLESDFFVFLNYNEDMFVYVYVYEDDDPAVYRFETELFYCGEDYIPESSKWNLPKGVSKLSDKFSSLIEQIVLNLKNSTPPS